MSKEQPEALPVRLAKRLCDGISTGHDWPNTDDELLRMQSAAELCRLHDVEMELQALRAQIGQGEPVAWRTFDGEGGYDYRTYEGNETYDDDWAKRNPRHVGWVDPIYLHPAPQQIGQGVPDGLFESQIEPRPLLYPLSDYHRAMTDGPLHYTWIDKPHRLVYDLIAAVRYYASAPPAPQANKTHVLVPLRMTRAMQDVVSEEDWSWAELLAAAEAVTEEEFTAAEQAKPIMPQAAVVQQKPVNGEWVERWHGSKTDEGWSILFQSLVPRDKVAYLGTGVSAEAVQSIVYAHNQALSASQQKPLLFSEIWDNDAIMEVNADARLPFEMIERFVRAIEAAHNIGEKK